MAMAMPASQTAILVTLAAGGEAHGYAIMQDVRAAGERMGPATLYTAIGRLLELHLVEEASGRRDDGRRDGHDDSRRRYYRITPRGRAALVVELDRLHATLERAAAAGIDRRAWRPSGPTGRLGSAGR